MPWWRSRYDPYRVIDLPPFGVALLPDRRGLRAIERGDDRWVVAIGAAIGHADRARLNPSEEARDLAAAWVDGAPPERAAAEVQWGLAFARHDPDRRGEVPPVAHESYLRELVNRTRHAEGLEQVLAAACRRAFVHGRQ